MQAVREHVPYFRTSMNFLHFRESTFDAPLHFHPEYELTYIVRGSGRRFVGDSVETFAAGDLVLLGAELPHFWQCEDTEESRGGPAEALICQFRRNFLGEQIWAVPEFEAAAQVVRDAGRGFVVTGTVADEIRSSLTMFPTMPSRHRIVAVLDLLVMLGDAGDNLRPLASSAYVPNLRSCDEPRLQRVYRLIDARYAGDLSLGEAAKAAAMTPSAFCRYFRDRTGRTFVSMLNEIRIGHACQALMGSNDLIVDVAERCGFRNLANFNRQFKKVTGNTPRSYRNLHRG